MLGCGAIWMKLHRNHDELQHKFCPMVQILILWLTDLPVPYAPLFFVLWAINFEGSICLLVTKIFFLMLSHYVSS